MLTIRPYWLLSACLIGSLLAGGCRPSGGSAASQAAAAGTLGPPLPTASLAAAESSPSGDRAPAQDFAVRAIDGKEITLHSLSGKVIVLDFWATWCGPCRMSVPILAGYHAKYASKGLAVIGISSEAPNLVTPVAKEIGMTYTVVGDPEGGARAADTYRVNGLPTLVVIDRQGKVRLREEGLDMTPGNGTQERLDALLPTLLAEK